MGDRDGAAVAPVLPSFTSALPLTRAAVAYADAAHRGRRRESDQASFILHPLEVASLLHVTGAPDPVIAAGVLHDVLEEDRSRAGELASRFGGEVAALVEVLSEDPEIGPYAERKAALRRQVAAGGPEAGAIFAADKLAKVRELRVRIGRAHLPGGSGPPDIEAKLAHYTASLAMLETVIPASPLVRQLHFELEALAALPPAWAASRAG